MDLFFHSGFRNISRRDTPFFLAFAWITGLLFGVITSLSAGAHLASLMRMTAYSPVSIVGLLSAMLLPLLCSAFAVYISCPRLLSPIAFVKAFFYAYFCFGVFAGFGSAGGLIRLLLIFSDTAMLPVLWLYWLRSTGSPGQFLYRTVPAIAAAVLIGSIDYSVISPFLAQILSN